MTVLPSGALAATALIAGYGVAVATGSRALGGLLLAVCGLICVLIWLRRDGRRTAAVLTLVGLVAFALSHVIGLLIGAWPAVLLTAAGASAACWQVSDRRHARRKRTTDVARASA